MKWSRLLIPTTKEVPADAEVLSHQLMIRGGFIRRVASGTYTYLLAGQRCLRKIMQIVREEIDAAGAQEILVPSVQPMELWQQTGRDIDYGETLGKFKDRHGRMNVLAPTAEEVFTFHGAHEINSYKQLPINLYQISFKFRDEFRPRFGVLRSREFIMKDAYSFNADEASLEETYRQMYDAYCRVFERCGTPYVIVQAESGEMGGSGSHQFTVPCDAGEDVIVHTEDNSYAANIEKAAVDPLEKEGTGDATAEMDKVHTPNTGTIAEVCDFLKTQASEMIKTLIYSDAQPEEGTGKSYVVLVRGDHEVNEEKLRGAAGGSVTLAEEEIIMALTSAATGFAGPMGLAEKVDKLIIDHAVAVMAAGVSGANETDYHIKNVVPGRDFPLEGANIVVTDVRNACEGDTYEGKMLLFRRGIEVGQVFKLGTKYSAKLGAKFLDESGREQVCLMGCYGIGVNRIMASAIETSNDKNGVIWPISIAPFEVLITSVNQDDSDVAAAAGQIYETLRKDGVDVLLDDRVMRGGGKFKDADLLGVPVRITVGKRGLAEGNVEIKLRRDEHNETIPLDQAVAKTKSLVQQLLDELK